MNPPHRWHITVIEKALTENDKVCILLWCNWIIDQSNPLTFQQREKLLNKYFWDNKNLEIDIIKDTKTDLEWVQNISAVIQKYWNIQLNVYWWDLKNDSAILAMKEYELLLSENVSYIPVDRFLETINYNWEDFHISATNLRNALRNWNNEFVEKFCNEELVEEIISFF
jgi:nicotinamide mononucleotide adenylyltransferase